MYGNSQNTNNYKEAFTEIYSNENQCYNTGKLHKGMKVDVARSN